MPWENECWTSHHESTKTLGRPSPLAGSDRPRWAGGTARKLMLMVDPLVSPSPSDAANLGFRPGQSVVDSSGLGRPVAISFRATRHLSPSSRRRRNSTSRSMNAEVQAGGALELWDPPQELRNLEGKAKRDSVGRDYAEPLSSIG